MLFLTGDVRGTGKNFCAKDSFGHVQLKAVKDFDELPAHSHLCVAGFPAPCHRFLMLMERVCWNCQCDFGRHRRFVVFLHRCQELLNTSWHWRAVAKQLGALLHLRGAQRSIHARGYVFFSNDFKQAPKDRKVKSIRMLINDRSIYSGGRCIDYITGLSFRGNQVFCSKHLGGQHGSTK